MQKQIDDLINDASRLNATINAEGFGDRDPIDQVLIVSQRDHTLSLMSVLILQEQRKNGYNDLVDPDETRRNIERVLKGCNVDDATKSNLRANLIATFINSNEITGDHK